MILRQAVREWGVEICNLMVATTTGTGGNENHHKGEYFEQNKIVGEKG